MGWEEWGVLGTWAAVAVALSISIMGNRAADKREEKSRSAQDKRDTENRLESLEVRMAEQRRYLTGLLFDHLREVREAYDEAILSIRNSNIEHATFAESAKFEAESSVYELFYDVMNARSAESLHRALRSISESAAQNWNADLLKQKMLAEAEVAHRHVRGDFFEER
jgi:uncharacterized coiled-coil protein SlyX